MMKKQLFGLLILIGIINALIIIIGALTGPNTYTLANNLSGYFDYLLCFVPLGLVTIAIGWWLVDIYLKTEDRLNYFAMAFSGILADAVFVIGTILFSPGH